MPIEKIMELLFNVTVNFEDIPLGELPSEELIHIIQVLRGNRAMLFGLVFELQENVKQQCHTVYFSPVAREGIH